jgi:hypothetical protein
MRVPWQFEEPACAEVGGNFWFPEKNDSSIEMTIAKNICSSCTHKTECLEWAIDNFEHGIWGGTNNLTRQRIRAKRSKQSAKSN